MSDLVQRQVGCHIGQREFAEGDGALAGRAGGGDHCVARQADQHLFRRRVEMAERAADCAAIARLAMADVEDALAQQRMLGGDQIGEFDVALARHGADL